MFDAELDRKLMLIALRAARGGRPSPNPHVGALVAHGRSVLGIGYHARAGEAHAEIVALEQAGARARGATLYVTLEPCNHHGRTGPCTDAIIAAGLARVVVGCLDPAPHVPGALARLRAAGVEVTTETCEDAAKALVDDFAKHFTTGLPFVTLAPKVGAGAFADGNRETAPALSGATIAQNGKGVQTGIARRRALRMRAESDAVLVGIGTVLADDPLLRAGVRSGLDPVRVVLDTHLRTPASARVVRHESDSPTWIFYGPNVATRRIESVQRAGVELIEMPLTGQHIDLRAVLQELGRRDVVRLLVEAGPRVRNALLRSSQVDRVASGSGQE
jgi:diaminohydroxyphosphoribosylaminopyrimidine deaminase/5-amino-6-(5-phosphoribosylamino)uracil reductase